MKPKSLGNLLVVGQFSLLAVLLLVQGSHDWVLQADVASAIKVAATAALIVGLIVAAAAIFNLGKSLTANPVPLESATLKTGGLYAVVRHPIYLGFILCGASLAATANSFVGLFAFAGLVGLLSFKARFEESMLLQKYPGYRAYAAKVGRIVPGIGKLKA